MSKRTNHTPRPSEITPERVYLSRRSVVASLVAAGIGLGLPRRGAAAALPAKLRAQHDGEA